MQLHKTHWRVFSFLIALLILTACGARETPAPTLDTNTIFTQAAQTVSAQFTLTAAAQPTGTSVPTQAPATVAPASTSALDAGTVPTQFLINTPLVNASATLSLLPQATVTGGLCNNSAYVADVGMPDGSVLKPGQAFVKGWLIMNTGTCNWIAGYSLQRVGGNTNFDAPIFTIQLLKDFVIPGQITEISLHMTAPKTPGKYEARYQMYSDLIVPFGTGLTVSIEVKK